MEKNRALLLHYADKDKPKTAAYELAGVW